MTGTPRKAGPGWARPEAPAPAPFKVPPPDIHADVEDPGLTEPVRIDLGDRGPDLALEVDVLADRLERHGPARHDGGTSTDLAARILKGTP